MGEKQVVVMVLKVDLTCHQCYKKVKRVLCKFPQIRDQVYDEKQNTVTIKVVCCRPEKIMEEIICKGGESIKSIEIKVAEKPKPKEPEKTNEKPKEPEKPNEKPKETEKPKPTPPASPSPDPDPCVTRWPPLAYPPFRTCCLECYEGRSGSPCHYGRGGLPDPSPSYQPKPVPPTPTPAPDPCVARYPPLAYPPFGACCQECYEDRGGGPCHYGHVSPPVPPPCYQAKPARPAPPKPVPAPAPNPTPAPVAKYPPSAYPALGTCCQECYEGRGGGPCYYGRGDPPAPPRNYQYYGYYGRPVYVNRCDYFSEENSGACSIM